jgi:hypothetical protein
MGSTDELVDILKPPAFEKTGQIKTKDQAYNNGDWIATFNLWIFQKKPVPAILYQLRSTNSTLEPNVLDVTIGGHYQAGETLYHGLREGEEELGKLYTKTDVRYLGPRIYLGLDVKKRLRHNLVHTFYTIDNSPLTAFRLQKSEVDGLFTCPVNKVIKLFTGKIKSFEAKGINNQRQLEKIKVTLKSFPYNFDNYHRKIAFSADRILKGEKNIFI